MRVYVDVNRVIFNHENTQDGRRFSIKDYARGNQLSASTWSTSSSRQDEELSLMKERTMLKYFLTHSIDHFNRLLTLFAILPMEKYLTDRNVDKIILLNDEFVIDVEWRNIL